MALSSSDLLSFNETRQTGYRSVVCCLPFFMLYHHWRHLPPCARQKIGEMVPCNLQLDLLAVETHQVPGNPVLEGLTCSRFHEPTPCFNGHLPIEHYPCHGSGTHSTAQLHRTSLTHHSSTHRTHHTCTCTSIKPQSNSPQPAWGSDD